MRSLLLAWLTAVWMLRKRQRLSCPRRRSRLPAPLLALEDLLDEPLRVRLADDQRLLVVPAVAGHRRPCSDRGRTPGARGGRAAVPVRSANAPRTATSVHTLLIRPESTPFRNALESLAVLPRLGLILLALLLAARERLRGAARPAPALQVRARDHPARAEHDLDRRRQGPAPEGVRLDRRLPPQPAAPRRLGPARRRDPPHHAVWLINGRPTFAAGEEKTQREAAARLRLALLAGRPVGPQPHDPQPAAEPRQGLHHLRHRLHPRLVAGREEDPPGQDAVARRRGRQGLSGVRRPPRQRPRRALHLPRRRARRLRRRAGAQHAGRPARRRAGGDGRAPPPRRPLHRPQAHARRAHGQPVPLEGALLGAGRRGVVGRGDDRDDARTGA